MANIISFKPNAAEEDLVPMEEWDGECWKTAFNELAKLAPEHDPWDVLAQFIKLTLMKNI